MSQSEMNALTFDDVVEQWESINYVVDGYSFINAMWVYCKKTNVKQWRRVFINEAEQTRFIYFFREEKGYVRKEEEKLFHFGALRETLLPYFYDTDSRECGFIAGLLLKFFDLLHPRGRRSKNLYIIGPRKKQAENNMVTTSKWCFKLVNSQFEETDSEDE